MSVNLDAALACARKGLHVFPLFYVLKDGTCSCRARPTNPCTRVGKHPATKNGLVSATTDEATIRKWWTESPWANIGLATGHGGLIVIDVDSGPKKDGSGNKVGEETLTALLEQEGPLPETLMVRTGSGGRHLYFYSTQEIKNDQGKKLGKDIDIRGHGGYVILPPSNHESGKKYQWVNEGVEIAGMPEWMEKRCMGKVAIDMAEDTLQPEVLKDAMETKLSKEQFVRLLDFIPADCDRDAWWQVGAALKKELGDRKGFEAWDNWSRKAPGKYDPKVMESQWASFTDDRRGTNGKAISGGTIVHYAKTLGDFRGFDIEAADAPEFKEEWCYVAAIKRFVNIRAFDEWDREQFDAMQAPLFLRGKASEHVLKNPEFRRVNSATYWPEKGPWVEEFGVSKINYWRGVDMTARPGDASPFLEHIAYLYPDPGEAKILLQYLAWQVQKPGEKVHWALLLVGDPGTGKSYFATAMGRVLGDHNVRMVSNEELHEAFTGWQRNTQLVMVEELKASDRMEIMNKLKPMITEPWCSIREMYRPPYKQPNRFNFLFCSNFDNALLLDAKDRRYCVLQSEARPKDPKYYAGLFDWTRRNADVLLWYLKTQVDVTDFPAKAHAPMSEGKRQMILETMPRLDRFIYERVASREYPFRWDLQKTSELPEVLRKMYGFAKVDPTAVADAFKRLGYLRLGRVRMPGEDGEMERPNLWAVRGFDVYRQLSGEQLRKVWHTQTDNSPVATEETENALIKFSPRNDTSDDGAFQ